MLSDQDRLKGKIVIRDSGCWEWAGTRNQRGYGVLIVQGKSRTAHRFVWETLVGPIPEGLVIDHLCRNHPCVNPAHLEPVTSRVNTLRGVGPTSVNATRTACPKGHPYDDENTYTQPSRKRSCRICMREAKRVWGQLRTECPRCGRVVSKRHLAEHRRSLACSEALDSAPTEANR